MRLGRQSGEITKGGPSVSYGDSGIEDELANVLGDLARALESETTQVTTLRAIVVSAVDTVPGAGSASICAIRNGNEVVTLMATDPLAEAVNEAQFSVRQGPCFDTLYKQRTIRLSDLRSETRWPNFTEAAGRLGVGSMLAVQLFVHDGDLGVLNLLSKDVGAFVDESEDVALLFATHAAVAMASADEEANLRLAIDTRDLIGQAKGVLIERFKLTSNQAFQLLVHASQHTNKKLIEVAEELLRSGALLGPSK